MNTPQKPGWIARILLTLATLGLVIVGFFFLTAALIAGALLALVVGVRLWWTIRKLKRAQAQGETGADLGTGAGVRRSSQGAPLDGEYQVIERETSGERVPPSSQADKPPHDR